MGKRNKTGASAPENVPPSVEAQTEFPDIPAAAFEEPVLAMPSNAPNGAQASKRPLAGEVLPGEPTKIEILRAAMNVPCEKHYVLFKGEKCPIADFTNLGQEVWLNTLGPMLDDSLKSVAPMILVLLNSYHLLNLFSGNILKALREVARTASLTELQAHFMAMNVNADVDSLEKLQQAAQEGRTTQFHLTLISIALKSISGPLGSAFTEGNISFTTAIQRLSGPALMDMVVASLTSSMRRRGIPYEESEIREELELWDKFDQFDCVFQQFEHYQQCNGKWARFFGQIRVLAMKNTPTEMLLG